MTQPPDEQYDDVCPCCKYTGCHICDECGYVECECECFVDDWHDLDEWHDDEDWD